MLIILTPVRRMYIGYRQCSAAQEGRESYILRRIQKTAQVPILKKIGECSLFLLRKKILAVGLQRKRDDSRNESKSARTILFFGLQVAGNAFKV